ncbi:hypothetical protein [Micromonospora inyonensis]|uniref:Uncharacterized protein n=1 Tax=Micromonospora inyonensis TaxID=47866 RepID=A0A1C6S1B4_9ACTN|nr:hypothetical protein [Micromonospora inyonensis]SCL23264.1 hypothetical protein GA0074694_3600 [Micromonospora inyonensis]
MSVLGDEELVAEMRRPDFQCEMVGSVAVSGENLAATRAELVPDMSGGTPG